MVDDEKKKYCCPFLSVYTAPHGVSGSSLGKCPAYDKTLEWQCPLVFKGKCAIYKIVETLQQK